MGNYFSLASQIKANQFTIHGSRFTVFIINSLNSSSVILYSGKQQIAELVFFIPESYVLAQLSLLHIFHGKGNSFPVVVDA